jgi:hypothetical protein
MQRTDTYALPPGCCRICQCAVTPLVDTYIDLDEPGGNMPRLYVCANCVSTFVSLLGGWVPEQTHLDALAQLEKAKQAAADSRRREQAAIDWHGASIRLGTFTVEAELFESLAPDEKEVVLARLSKAVEKHVRAQGVKPGRKTESVPA